MRLCLIDRMHEILTSDDPQLVDTLLATWGLPTTLSSLVGGVLKELRATAKQAGIDQMPLERQQAMVQALTDAVLSKVSFDGVKLNAQYGVNPDAEVGPADPVLPALVELLGLLRQKAALKLAASKTYFDQQDYLQTANAKRAPQDRYSIVKASDLGDFVVHEYLARNDTLLALDLEAVTQSVDAQTEVMDGKTVDTRYRMLAAAGTIAFQLTFAMIQNTQGVKDLAIKTIQDFGQAAP
jgi:hypothetical protein